LTTFWALDLGESEIAAVKIAAGRHVPDISDFTFVPIAASPSGRGPAETRQALVDLTRRLHLRRVVVHVGGGAAETVIRDELLSQEDLDGTPETVRKRLLDLLPGDLAAREVRYEPAAHLDRDDELVPYRLLSVCREAVKRSHAMMQDASLECAALHSGALGLTAAAERLAPSADPFALLRIGRRVTVLAIHQPGHAERFRIPFGEEDLAGAVASARSVPMVEAYALLTAGADDPGAVATSRALAEPLDLLARDVLRLLEYYSDRLSDRSPDGIHPVGSVATRPLIAARLAAVPELGLRPLTLPPSGALKWSGRARTPDRAEAYPRLLGAIGVGLLGARPAEDPLVLRPLPPAPERVRIGPHVAAAALLVLLTLLTWWAAVGDRERLRDLETRQQDLALRLPAHTRSPERIEADGRLVENRLRILERKAGVRRALMAVDALFPEPREGEFYLLESLRFDGERVEAILRVRVPRGTDPTGPAENQRVAVPDRLAESVGPPDSARVEMLPDGYRVHAAWRVPGP
jgi:hypothetical protein